MPLQGAEDREVVPETFDHLGIGEALRLTPSSSRTQTSSGALSTA